MTVPGGVWGFGISVRLLTRGCRESSCVKAMLTSVMRVLCDKKDATYVTYLGSLEVLTCLVWDFEVVFLLLIHVL